MFRKTDRGFEFVSASGNRICILLAECLKTQKVYMMSLWLAGPKAHVARQARLLYDVGMEEFYEVHLFCANRDICPWANAVLEKDWALPLPDPMWRELVSNKEVQEIPLYGPRSRSVSRDE